LDFHPHIRRVAFERGANSHAIVPTCLQAEFETKDEIRVLLLRIEIPPTVLGADDHAVLDDITRPVTAHKRPTLQRLAIKQFCKPGLVTSKEKGCQRDRQA
jgi:hypothetical protein